MLGIRTLMPGGEPMASLARRFSAAKPRARRLRTQITGDGFPGHG
jgi:hypothetical protein